MLIISIATTRNRDTYSGQKPKHCVELSSSKRVPFSWFHIQALAFRGKPQFPSEQSSSATAETWRKAAGMTHTANHNAPSDAIWCCIQIMHDKQRLAESVYDCRCVAETRNLFKSLQSKATGNWCLIYVLLSTFNDVLRCSLGRKNTYFHANEKTNTNKYACLVDQHISHITRARD